MINLTSLFYDLINDGFIYEEDENGLNMSYGEYVAIYDHFFNAIVEDLKEAVGYNTTIEELAEKYNEIIETADDDTRMFAGIGDDDTVAYAEYYKDNGYFTDILKALEEEDVEIDYEIREEE